MTKGHYETMIIELGNPSYAKVGTKMMNLEGNEVDVLSSTSMGPGYRYFKPTKLHPSSKVYSISPFEVKKRRCRYVIYKQIDATSDYFSINDKDSILEKFKHPAKEKIKVEN
jgi:pre-mRNA-splicing factor ISY1